MGNITLNITGANATLHDHNFSVVECNYFGRVELEEVEVKGREVGLSRAFSDMELEELLKASPDYRSIGYLTAFHADIWQGELAKLKLGYINLTSKIPHILARASTQRIQKMPEYL